MWVRSTFIGRDKTHGLHKIRQKDGAYSYGCPHFSTIESDSPLEPCWPVKQGDVLVPDDHNEQKKQHYHL